MSSPLILITNDDGIFSKGLRHLVKLINPIAKVVVVAPDSPQSAQSHAITINQPITCEKIDVDDGKQIDFICSGTPSSIGIFKILMPKFLMIQQQVKM